MSGCYSASRSAPAGKTNIPGNLDQENDNMDLEMEDGIEGSDHHFQITRMPTLKSHMQKIGVKDAWVVPYRDGVRISLVKAGINVKVEGTDEETDLWGF